LKTYFRLLPFLRPYIWPYFILGMICMLGYGATDGAIPFLVQHVMDDVFGRKDAGTLSFLPFLVIGVFALRGLLNFGQSYLGDFVGLRIINDVRGIGRVTVRRPLTVNGRNRAANNSGPKARIPASSRSPRPSAESSPRDFRREK